MKNREAYKNELSGVQRGDLCGFIQSNLLRKYGLCCPDIGCDECLGKMFEIWLDEEYEASEQEVERKKIIVIKTEFVELPEYCEACRYFGSRPHPRDGWMDLCELCGERIDADGCKDDGWCYDGNKRPDNCPLMEVTDDK